MARWRTMGPRAGLQPDRRVEEGGMASGRSSPTCSSTRRSPRKVEAEARKYLLEGWFFRGSKNADKVDFIRGVRWPDDWIMQDQRTAYKSNADALARTTGGNDNELPGRLRGLRRRSPGLHQRLPGEYLPVGRRRHDRDKGYRARHTPREKSARASNQGVCAVQGHHLKDGVPAVSEVAFLDALPAEIREAPAPARPKLERNNMVDFLRAVARGEAQGRREARGQEAARGVAGRPGITCSARTRHWPPLTVRGTPVGPLSEEDLSALFDEAAAELSEAQQETPDPGAWARSRRPSPDGAAARASARGRVPASGRRHGAPRTTRQLTPARLR